METTPILLDIGSPVTTEIINDERIDDSSLGEMMYAAVVLQKRIAQRMANPDSFNGVAVFSQAGGVDWSGYPGAGPVNTEHTGSSDAPLELPEPVAPDNYCDTIPAIGAMLAQGIRAIDASMANYTRWLDTAVENPASYLGAPSESSFRDTQHYLRDTMKLSAYTAKKHYQRARYFTYEPGKSPELLTSQPRFPGIAELMAQGRIPGENADRIIGLDQDLGQYSKLVGQSNAYKNEVLQVFEPTLVEASESASPEELTKARQRWRDKIAHQINDDGPSPSQALRKSADNAVRMKDQADGSGKISMHATPAVYAAFKTFKIHMLNYDGKTPAVTPELLGFLKAAPTDASHHEHENVAAEDPSTDESVNTGTYFGSASIDPTAVVAEDADGNPVSTGELWGIDDMSPGQKLGAFLIGALHTVMSLDPTEAAMKSSHGSKAQIILVQDIQTAHHMLGFPALPVAVRRPSNADGITTPVIRQPKPATIGAAPSSNPEWVASAHYAGYVSPVPWTRFQSEAINFGPIHPKDTATLGCDSELCGQVWNGQDQVLHHGRTKRFFTPAQRKAILARDKGCQAPGCSVPAAYCDIHHILEWIVGGKTDETNAVTLCAHHHAAIHLGKWTILKHEGRTYFQPAKWLDPFQPLLRNIYWNI